MENATHPYYTAQRRTDVRPILRKPDLSHTKIPSTPYPRRPLQSIENTMEPATPRAELVKHRHHLKVRDRQPPVDNTPSPGTKEELLLRQQEQELAVLRQGVLQLQRKFERGTALAPLEGKMRQLTGQLRSLQLDNHRLQEYSGKLQCELQQAYQRLVERRRASVMRSRSVSPTRARRDSGPVQAPRCRSVSPDRARWGDRTAPGIVANPSMMPAVVPPAVPPAVRPVPPQAMPRANLPPAIAPPPQAPTTTPPFFAAPAAPAVAPFVPAPHPFLAQHPVAGSLPLQVPPMQTTVAPALLQPPAQPASFTCPAKPPTEEETRRAVEQAIKQQQQFLDAIRREIESLVQPGPAAAPAREAAPRPTVPAPVAVLRGDRIVDLTGSASEIGPLPPAPPLPTAAPGPSRALVAVVSPPRPIPPAALRPRSPKPEPRRETVSSATSPLRQPAAVLPVPIPVTRCTQTERDQQHPSPAPPVHRFFYEPADGASHPPPPALRRVSNGVSPAVERVLSPHALNAAIDLIDAASPVTTSVSPRTDNTRRSSGYRSPASAAELNDFLQQQYEAWERPGLSWTTRDAVRRREVIQSAACIERECVQRTSGSRSSTPTLRASRRPKRSRKKSRSKSKGNARRAVVVESFPVPDRAALWAQLTLPVPITPQK